MAPDMASDELRTFSSPTASASPPTASGCFPSNSTPAPPCCFCTQDSHASCCLEALIAHAESLPRRLQSMAKAPEHGHSTCHQHPCSSPSSAAVPCASEALLLKYLPYELFDEHMRIAFCLWPLLFRQRGGTPKEQRAAEVFAESSGWWLQWHRRVVEAFISGTADRVNNFDPKLGVYPHRGSVMWRQLAQKVFHWGLLKSSVSKTGPVVQTGASLKRLDLALRHISCELDAAWGDHVLDSSALAESLGGPPSSSAGECCGTPPQCCGPTLQCCATGSYPAWCACLRASWRSARSQLCGTPLSAQCLPGEMEEEPVGPKQERPGRSN